MIEWLLLAELYIHTTFSRGTIPIKEGEAGLDAIIIANHRFDTQSLMGLFHFKEVVDGYGGKIGHEL